jgi:hypothetical protein
VIESGFPTPTGCREVERARLTALDILGDREGAAAIVERRLRSGDV